MLIAGLAYLASLVIYLINGENSWVRLLWIIGIAIFLISQLHHQKMHIRFHKKNSRDLFFLATICAVAFFLRFWRLAQIPNYVHGDISSQGLQALEIIHNPTTSWFSVGWSNIPMFDFVMMAGTMKIFGANLFGLSMTAVWQGMFTIPALYWLGQEMFGKRTGLLAATFLAINYTHIHFSRIVTSASPLLFMVLSLAALFRGMRTKNNFWFGVAGVALGVGLLVYYPIRIAVVVAVLLFLWLMIWQRSTVIKHWQAWLNYAIGAMLGFGPMMAYVAKNFQNFVGRGSEVTLANSDVMTHLLNKYGVASTGEVWVEQVRRSFLTFYSVGDASTHFGFPGPIISTLPAIFFILGVGYALLHLRNERLFLLLCWLIGTLVLGSVITNDPPFWPHIVILLPAVMLLAAVGLERFWLAIEKAGRKRIPRLNLILGILVATSLTVSGINNWQQYLQFDQSNSGDRFMQVGRFAADLPRNYTFYTISPGFNRQRREIEFNSQGLAGENIPSEQLFSGNLPAISGPTIFVFAPEQIEIEAILENFYPGGMIEQHANRSGQLMFSSYTVIANATNSGQPLSTL